MRGRGKKRGGGGGGGGGGGKWSESWCWGGNDRGHLPQGRGLSVEWGQVGKGLEEGLGGRNWDIPAWIERGEILTGSQMCRTQV